MWKGEDRFRVEDETKGISVEVVLDASPRLRDMLLAGGLLNYTKKCRPGIKRRRQGCAGRPAVLPFLLTFT